MHAHSTGMYWSAALSAGLPTINAYCTCNDIEFQLDLDLAERAICTLTSSEVPCIYGLRGRTEAGIICEYIDGGIPSSPNAPKPTAAFKVESTSIGAGSTFSKYLGSIGFTIECAMAATPCNEDSDYRSWRQTGQHKRAGINAKKEQRTKLLRCSSATTWRSLQQSWCMVYPLEFNAWAWELT